MSWQLPLCISSNHLGSRHTNAPPCHERRSTRFHAGGLPSIERGLIPRHRFLRNRMVITSIPAQQPCPCTRCSRTPVVLLGLPTVLSNRYVRPFEQSCDRYSTLVHRPSNQLMKPSTVTDGHEDGHCTVYGRCTASIRVVMRYK